MNWEDTWNAIWEWAGVRTYQVPGPSEAAGDVVLDVPCYRQLTTYDCGFAAGLSVLHAFTDTSAERFYQAVSPDPKWGTSTSRLIRALRDEGLQVARRINPSYRLIEGAIRSGSPVLATLRRSASEEHWVALIGITQDREVLVAGDSAWKVVRMDWASFKRQLGSDRAVLICRGK